MDNKETFLVHFCFNDNVSEDAKLETKNAFNLRKKFIDLCPCGTTVSFITKYNCLHDLYFLIKSILGDMFTNGELCIFPIDTRKECTVDLLNKLNQKYNS